VDCGMSAGELREVVRVGDVVSFDRAGIELANNRVAGKSMDDRAGVAVMHECALELQKLKHDAMFTSLQRCRRKWVTEAALRAHTE